MPLVRNHLSFFDVFVCFMFVPHRIVWLNECLDSDSLNVYRRVLLWNRMTTVQEEY